MRKNQVNKKTIIAPTKLFPSYWLKLDLTILICKVRMLKLCLQTKCVKTFNMILTFHIRITATFLSWRFMIFTFIIRSKSNMNAKKDLLHKFKTKCTMIRVGLYCQFQRHSSFNYFIFSVECKKTNILKIKKK